MKIKAIVFDRDGTLMEHVEYPSHPKEVRLVPGAKRLLTPDLFDFRMFLHSNQSGPERGINTKADCLRVQEEFLKQLGGNPFLHSWMSFEAPGDEGPGSTRKPSPQVINTIATALGYQPQEIVMIGDSECDALAAENAGARSILLRSPRNGRFTPDVNTLNEAIDLLLK